MHRILDSNLLIVVCQGWVYKLRSHSLYNFSSSCAHLLDFILDSFIVVNRYFYISEI
jgi:hypothetical protein